MTELEAVAERHSVRKYLDKPLDSVVVSALNNKIDAINKKTHSNIQLIQNCEGVFEVSYGRLKGVKNYIALVCKNVENAEELMGYYGEELVLYAQSLGLNTCWVVLTYDSSKVDIEVKDDEVLVSLIAIGYGEHNGKPHISKSMEEVSNVSENDPSWFVRGVECSLLAPTALNQQKFYIKRNGRNVSISTSTDKYTSIDLGIVKYHFELGAGVANFNWEE